MNDFTSLGLMVDCSRNSVLTVSAVNRLIDLLSSLGYTSLQLYTEDTYTVENEKYFGYLRGRYSMDEIKEMDEHASEKGMTLIPCIQTLAHLSKIFRWKPYWEINDCNDILLAENDRTYELIDNMFASLEKCFKSRSVNIGMDEAHMLGLGKYKDLHGEESRSEIMLSHLNKVLEIAKKHGFKCCMWSDMFFRLAGGDYYNSGSEVKVKIPENLELIYWDYYSTDEEHYSKMMRAHKKIADNVSFAGGLWTWTGLVPHNGYALKASRAAMSECIKNGINKVFFTAWGDDGGFCSPFSVLPAIFAVSEYAKGNFDENSIKQKFFERFSVKFDDYMQIDAPNEISLKNEADVVNPSKYLLYNDCFLGMFDSAIPQDCNKKYAGIAANLRKLQIPDEYKFAFKPVISLCECLSFKAELGLKTRSAYKNGDKKQLGLLLNGDYKNAVNKTEELYENLKEYWNVLYKPHGADVLDLRFGGIMARLKRNAEKLNDYLEGKTDIIEELEEEIYDYLGNEEFSGKPLAYNGFASNATVNDI